MHLVDRDRRIRRVPRGARAHPLVVAPAERRRARHHGGGGGRHLGLLRERIGLLRQAHAAGADDVELVARASATRGTNSSQTPAAMAQPHRMAPRVPGVEIADDRDAARVRRPDGKARAAHAVDRHRIGAERFGELEVPPFVEQVQVEVAEHGPERIGVLGLLHGAGPGDAQQIGRALGDDALEQAAVARVQAAEAARGPSAAAPRPRRAPGRKRGPPGRPRSSCGPSRRNGSPCSACASASISWRSGKRYGRAGMDVHGSLPAGAGGARRAGRDRRAG